MLNTKVFVKRFLTQPVQIRWVKTIPALVLDHYFSPPSWQEWMTFLEIDWNYSLSPIAFLMSLPSIFSRIIGLNIFEMLYETLLGLGMIINIDVLKYNGQCPKSIHVLTILIKLLRQLLLLTMTLRCL